MRNGNKGFTLVELLIVVAIIGILAGAVLIVINPTELIRRSNDSKRLSELDTLNKALILATTDGEIVLTACASNCTSATGTQSIAGSGYVTFTINTGMTGLGKYLSTLPVDPVNDTARGLYYSYQADATNQTFELNAVLESSQNSGRMAADGGNDNAVFEIGTDPGLDLL